MKRNLENLKQFFIGLSLSMLVFAVMYAYIYIWYLVEYEV